MAAGGKDDTTGTVVVALVANFCIAVMKFIVAAISGSAAMMAEGYHSVADTGNQAFLLLGIHSSKRPPDKRHPFGYGKDRFFWSFVVAVSMFTMGSALSIYHGIEKISAHHPGPMEVRPLVYNGIVLVLAMGAETIAFRKAWKALDKSWTEGSFFTHVWESRNVTLLTVFFEDLAALLGLAFAGIGLLITYLTGNWLYDGITSIVIGLLLAGVALFIAYKSRRLLLGQQAPGKMVEFIKKNLADAPEIHNFDHLRTMHLGSDRILVTALLRLDRQVSVMDADRVTDGLEDTIRSRYPSVKHIYFEVEDLEGDPVETESSDDSDAGD